MPVEIDVAQRLATIADATLEIVAAEGIDGVSIRAVAKRIGGSTTLITNYLPTRESLLRNAIDHAIRAWEGEMEQAVERVGDRERLAVAARWACSTTGNDEVLRRLFMEILGRSEPDSEALRALRDDSRRTREQLVDAARDAGADDAAFTAEILYLVFRGFYVSSLEDPEYWNSEHMIPFIERLIRLLTSIPQRGAVDGSERVRVP
ncbi:TetR/AcrR family transcriptional regulator [Actinomadura sp. 3N407]|uniref:TetR/AcrR family transcriptional regulator n=1 Tax=Actinomadura sp. 3N407 TaxID=3457423 RepID=UPI003FCD87BD